MTDDAELLRLYGETHSEAAFAELVQRHLTLVYSTALRLLNGDAHAAEDVAQTVFTALARKAPSLTSRATLAGWLYLGAHHAAAQIVRGENRRRTREQQAHSMHDLSATSESTADWDRVRPVLDHAMRELSDPDREAVLLRYFEQRPFAEIGSVLKLSDDAARMRVDRALEKLRALLQRRAITSTAAALATALGNQAMVAAPTGLASAITGTALAGVAATAATASLFTTGFFMTKTTASLGIAVLALSTFGTAFYFADQARRSESAAANANRELAALRGRIVETEQRANRAEQEVAFLKNNSAELNKKAALKTSPAAGSSKFSYVIGGATFTPTPPPTDAEGIGLLRENAIEEGYGALFRQLGFTRLQAEQFKSIKLQILDKRNERIGARMNEAAAQSGKPSPADIKKIAEQTFQEANVETEASLRNAFGDEIYARIEHFEFTRPVRHLADQLAASLFNSTTPLKPDQADDLVEIMAKSARSPSGKVELKAMNGPLILQESQKVLTPDQLPPFTRIITQQVKEQLDRERLLDEARPGATPAP